MLDRLQQLNTKATVTFIEAQVALLKEVDRVCALIASSHKSIDLLWLSQGGLANANGALSPEGLNDDLAISFYSRFLFMQRLIPLLNGSSKDARIVSVLSAGQEGNLITSDLGLNNTKDLGVFPLMKHHVTMTSLAMHELAEQNPKISFIHTNPGMVSTKVHDEWIDGWTGIWAVIGWIFRRTMLPLMHSLGYSPEEAGETGFYELTNSGFVAQRGKNFWRLSEKADILKENALLQKYEDGGWRSKVLEHAMQTGEKVLDQ
jgi:NAD(P)-dependent dehydrogenase (short-subunit alcohol dehydrogenase family)